MPPSPARDVARVVAELNAPSELVTQPVAHRGWGDAIVILGVLGGAAVGWAGFPRLGPLSIIIGIGIAVQGFWLKSWHYAAAEALDHLAAIREALAKSDGRPKAR